MFSCGGRLGVAGCSTAIGKMNRNESKVESRGACCVAIMEKYECAIRRRRAAGH
jgi:hypothetical protein